MVTLGPVQRPGSDCASAGGRRRRRSGLVGVIGLLLALSLSACGDTGFVGKRVDNFTAFYNTFHNANLAYEKGVDQLDDRNRPVDRSVYMSLFLQPPQGGSQGESFENAINKSADVLREHPTSKWVDDALLLIGKSYYFQGNDVGAEQKFREVVDLETGKEGEARFWLARVLVASRQFEEASQLMNASLADEEEDFGTWTDRMRLARAELYVRQERWTEAEQALERGLAGDVPDDLEARAAFLLGQVRETQGQPSAAATAFDRAIDKAGRYELRFAAEMSAIRMLGLAGRPDEALDRLRGVERDDKNYEKRFEVRLLKGRLQHMAGRSAEARATLRGLLYGEETPQSAVQGRAHYALGILYRDALADFSRAAAHFDTAATSLENPSGRGDQVVQRSPAAITNSQDLADRYGSLAEKGQTVARLDSLIRLGEMPPDEFQAAIADIREQRRAEQAAQARNRAEQEAATRFRSRGAQFDNADDRSQGFAQEQAAATQSSDAGFLFHRDAARVQEGKRSFERRWGNRPLVDHWRRIEAVRGQASEAPATADGPAPDAAGGGGGEGRAVESPIDVSAVPRDSARLAEARMKLAGAQYEFGNALFLAAGRPDSAATWYQRILDERPGSEVAQRALYALAEANRAQGRTEIAERQYERLLDRYPQTRFAERARNRLGRDEAAATVVDSAAVAGATYRRAYRHWTAGRLDTSLVEMLSIVRAHPTAPAAPRALLAGSMIYLEQLRQKPASARPIHTDSLVATLPFPESNPASVAGEGAKRESTGATPAPRRDPQGGGETAARSDTTAAPDARSGDARTPQNAGSSPQTPSRSRVDRVPRRVERSIDSVATDTHQEAASDAPADPAGGGSPSPMEAGPSRAGGAADTSRSDTSAADAARPRASGDTLGVADGGSATDSLATSARPPSADSLNASPAPEAADSVAAPAADSLRPARRMLRLLTTQYPETPQSRRARAMLVAMPAPPPDDAVSGDSVVAQTAPADTARAGSSGSDGGPASADSIRARVPTDGRPEDGASPAESTGPGPDDTAAGSAGEPSRWAIAVGPFPDRPTAARRRDSLEAATGRGYAFRVRSDTTASSAHHVLIGQFDTQREAAAARVRLRDVLPGSSRLTRVPSESTDSGRKE